MSTEIDLLRVVLALQMGFITKDQVVECGALWAEDRKKPLTQVLAEKGYLKPTAQQGLDVMVKAKLEEAGGDPARSLTSTTVGEDVRRSLLSLQIDEKARTVLLYMAPKPLEPSEPPPSSDRYLLESEIGRGGLGRVVAARDRVLNREVAVKEIVTEAAGHAGLVQRFLREGEIAGRLTHPNVIPVHDIGVREEGGESVPFFVMTRIVGRDLHEILQAVERSAWEDPSPAGEVDSGRKASGGRGDSEPGPRAKTTRSPREAFPRPRLLRIFQEVCLAMAYAHDHGVIHRDLKPANVMVGEYGEVYVVDWGLAKVKGQAEAPRTIPTGPGHEGESDAGLTTEGEVLGTPAYMPPEQADGRMDAVDERSDIYSLGAILYEILTFRPPYEGGTAMQVLAQVVTRDVTPPTRRISERIQSAHSSARRQAARTTLAPEEEDRRGDTAPSSPPGGEADFLHLEPVPAELEEIVLRALSKAKAKRYATVRDLHDDVQRFLEGEKQREYNRRRALNKVEEGRILAERMETMRIRLKALEAEAEAEAKKTQRPWPVERKRRAWALEKDVKDLRRDVVKTFGRAASTLQEALGFERKNPQARAALADLYWAQFLREEEKGDRNQMVYFEGLVRQYNDGQYDARLK
ncbi:MAG: serine/threonine-protein kinase, partial [Planctomycetota bacterium]